MKSAVFTPNGPTPESTSSPFTRVWYDFRRIFALTKPYRARLYAAIILSVLAASVALVIPMGLRELIDAVFEAGDRRLLHLLSAGLLVLFILRALMGFFGGYLLRWTGERVVADLRDQVYSHLQKLGVQYFAGERTGDIISRLTNDVASVRRAATSVFSAVLRQVLTLVGSIGLMFFLNWRLTLGLLTVVPPSTLAARYFGLRVRKYARRVQDRLADSTAVAEEALSAIRAVKAFARVDYESSRYRDAVEEVFEAARYRALLSIALSTIVGFGFYAALTGVFWFGGMEVLAGRLSVGDLVAFVFYARSVSRGIRVLAQVYSTLNQAIGASERLFEILDTPPKITDAPGAVESPTIHGRVQFQDVTFAYESSAPVLRSVTFSMRPGQTTALVGPSGAGKTTLLRLIPRFFDPDTGRITVDGYDISNISVKSLRRRIAIVSQSVQLFDASVAENIRYSRLDASDEEIREAAEIANAHEFITSLPDGYDTIVGEEGVKLSGGQRQRVSIARAVLNDARILLFDEPTSSLDSMSERVVQDALNRISRDRTTLTVSHRLASIRSSDTIMTMEDGEIVETGTHEELVAQDGLYREMYDIQFQSEGRSELTEKNLAEE